ncbi:MAG: nickel-responsive transcriptional regulator NikR [Syntrophales bacterium]
MSELVRFGVSLDKSLLDKFDRLICERRYTNRSEALRDLIRQELVKKAWAEDMEVAGAITFLFDHHQRDLLNRITDIQHDYQKLIISTQHVHLDHDNCLEIAAVRGRAGNIQELTDRLKSIRGVRHCSLSMSSAGQDVR